MAGFWATLVVLSLASAALMAFFDVPFKSSTPKVKTICALLVFASAAITLVIIFMFVSAGPAWSISIGLLALSTMIVIFLRRNFKKGDGQGMDSTNLTPFANGERKKSLAPFIGRATWISRATLKMGIIGLAIPGLTLFLYGTLETARISLTYIPPWESQPWKEGLTATVYWGKEPSQEARAGFEAVANLFGVPFSYVDSEREANLRIWPGTRFAGQCKLGAAAAYSSPDPIIGNGGLESGDIYICRWTLPSDKPPIPAKSLMAHETAHLLGAVPHFGNGLMAHMGGDGSWWFTEEEVDCMLYRVEKFRLEIEGATKNDEKTNQETNDSRPAHPDCPPPPRF